MSDAVFWQMVEAIGTILAFVLAFSFGLGGKITSFRNRPKVKLDFKDEENYVVRNIKDRVIEIRLKIVNNGLTTAKRTNVKLESVIQGEMNVLKRAPHENSFKLHISDEDLQNGEYKFLDLITKRGAVIEGRKKIELFTKSDQKIDEHDTVFNIIVTGDNFPAFKKSFKYEHNEDVREAKFYELSR